MKKLCNICGFMVADENMESGMRNLVNTYFEKVKERTREGKGIVEIINEVQKNTNENTIQLIFE